MKNKVARRDSIILSVFSVRWRRGCAGILDCHFLYRLVVVADIYVRLLYTICDYCFGVIVAVCVLCVM